jgi:ClpP class serine protease
MNPVLAHIDSKIWAILPAELNKLRAAAASPESSQIVPKAARMAGGDGPRLLNYTTISQDIATINVSGILYNPEGFIDELIEFYFGGTSIPALISDIEAVSSDTSVKSVLFNFHSPGGDVSVSTRLRTRSRHSPPRRKPWHTLTASAALQPISLQLNAARS